MTVGENVALPLREHTDLDADTIDIMVTIKLELVGLRAGRGPDARRDFRRHEEARRPGPRHRPGPGDPVLRRALGRAGPGHQRGDRPAHHGPGRQAGRHQRGGDARDGLGLPHRRPDGHAGQGPGAEGRRDGGNSRPSATARPAAIRRRTSSASSSAASPKGPSPAAGWTPATRRTSSPPAGPNDLGRKAPWRRTWPTRSATS